MLAPYITRHNMPNYLEYQVPLYKRQIGASAATRLGKMALGEMVFR
jgi:hypothetical protein